MELTFRHHRIKYQIELKRLPSVLKNLIILVFVFAINLVQPVFAQRTINIADGWANNSVNTVIFRKNSVVTHNDTQYVSFYDQESFVVLAKRKLGTEKWKISKTQFKGKTADAHNAISMMVDGDGYLHLSWDHHGNELRYCKSVSSGSLMMTEKLTMTGIGESNVTYPEFHKLPNGNLLFFFRDGASGKGNFVINRYDIATQKWKQLHSNLIDGEKRRNAYWQAFVDLNGTIHLSWVWRESPDVSSNHDMCYAASTNGGITWQKSTGEKYNMPINVATAEVISLIPQKSELINQTSMFADEKGNPIIASYWRDTNDSIPQFHIIYKLNNVWTTQNLGFRKTAFTLSGTGSKQIPISRPQIVTWQKGNRTAAALIFRDEERGKKVSLAINKNIAKNKWRVTDITKYSVGSWEPSFDTELWKQTKKMHLFVQFTEQIDGEGKADIGPQMVKILECKKVGQ